jgi:sugar lactone lactonase YvrE
VAPAAFGNDACAAADQPFHRSTASWARLDLGVGHLLADLKTASAGIALVFVCRHQESSFIEGVPTAIIRRELRFNALDLTGENTSFDCGGYGFFDFNLIISPSKVGSPLRLRIPVANPNRKVEESPGCGGVCWIPELGYMKVCGQTMKKTLLCAFTFCLCHTAFAASVITTRPDDPKAVYLDAPVANADSSAALQTAIDKAEDPAREGIVFIPEGRYTLTRTIYVWPGVRLIGYGATRPIFILPPNTPGFQKRMGVLVIFTGLAQHEDTLAGGPIPFPPPGTVPPNPNVADANSSTFYSAMTNIDFEIGDGNPAAVAIRFHVAQHAFLTHMDFHIGSGLAALYQIGNEAEDVHFYGGRYGILTENTSPAWQFTLIDSTFDGQQESAIREHEAGLTLIRDTFRDMPKAIDIDAGYPDQLWVKDCRFERISNAVVAISKEQSPLTEIGFEGAILAKAPIFARLRESGKTISGKGEIYRIKNFNYGLILPGEGRMGAIAMQYEVAPLSAMPAPQPPAIRALPPSSEWVNVHTLGVKGDGATDDTSALQQAIGAHRVLYFPSGHYVVRNTLTLKPDTVFIGLHPTMTQIDLLDETPGYQGVGAPKPVIFAPPGGANILSGIGMFTGGINPRAVAVLWKAGEDSLIDDVRFLGGHGSGVNPYNNDHTADPDLRKRWDSQYPSLWIADGGGGTFADIWIPNTFAQAGFVVSNTKTAGHVYELSNEHHVRNEIIFDHVENWEIDAPQTEEEAGESTEALSLEIDNSRNLTFANYHAYRVTRSRAPFPSAVRIYNSSEIHFRNVHVNSESGYPICDNNGCGTFLRASKFPYENAIQDVTHHLEVREREFAVLDIPGNPLQPAPPDASAILAPRATVKKLEDGFFSISGAAVDAKGKLYFVDRHNQRIYSWAQKEGLAVVRDNPLDPVSLAFDKSGNLLVVSTAGPEGTVYTFKPGSSAEELTVLRPQPAQPHANASVILPVNWWNNGEFQDQLNLDTMQFTTLAEIFAADATSPKKSEYVSTDGSVFLPAGRVFQQGPANESSGWRFSDNLDTYGFLTAEPGRRVYVSSESEDITYSASVNPDNSLSGLKPFAQRGGESVAVDGSGNVYVANGQIFVYSPLGKQIAEIDVPERPLQLVFGGPDRKTLFILAHHALFAAQLR